tara:strand:- start:62 stop:907 length:846 start_codon:yes stop_codon:yes gene_type:complete
MIFETTANGAVESTETMRIDAAGANLVGTAGLVINTDGTTNGSNAFVDLHYNGTAGSHSDGIRWFDKRDQNNAQIVNSLTSDGAGDEEARLLFKTSKDGALVHNMTLETNGDLTIENGNLVIGTAGKGIDFSAQAATSASGASGTASGAELLSHYEEGSWTVSVKQGGTSISYGTQVGRYTRVGRQVQAEFYMQVTLTGNAVHMQLQGLPFPVSTSNFARGWGGSSFESLVGTNSTQFYGAANVSYFNIYHSGDAAYAVADGTTRTNEYLIGMFIYDTDAA